MLSRFFNSCSDVCFIPLKASEKLIKKTDDDSLARCGAVSLNLLTTCIPGCCGFLGAYMAEVVAAVPTNQTMDDAENNSNTSSYRR